MAPPHDAIVKLAPGETRLDHDLFMDKGVPFRGRAIDAISGKPIGGVRVTAINFITSMGVEHHGSGVAGDRMEAITADDGTFEILHVGLNRPAAGPTLRCHFQKEGWRLLRTDTSQDRIEAARDSALLSFEYGTPEIVRTLEFSAVMYVRGMVVDRAGVAVSGATVIPWYRDHRKAVSSDETVGPRGTNTNHEGRFQIEVLPGAELALLIRKEGVGSAKVEPIRIGQTPPGPITVALQSTTCSGVVVMEGSGEPVAGAEVSAILGVDDETAAANRFELGKGTSGADGAFTFRDLPAGTLVMSAKKNGVIQRNPLRAKIADGENRTALRLELVGVARLAGRITNSAGVPQANVAVAAMAMNYSSIASTYSDAEGIYSFDAEFPPGRCVVRNVPAGRYTVKLLLRQTNPALPDVADFDTIDLTEGQTTECAYALDNTAQQ